MAEWGIRRSGKVIGVFCSGSVGGGECGLEDGAGKRNGAWRVGTFGRRTVNWGAGREEVARSELVGGVGTGVAGSRSGEAQERRCWEGLAGGRGRRGGRVIAVGVRSGMGRDAGGDGGMGLMDRVAKY
ncbi:hypothetical protein Tco_1508052 [Tanacetum coccineum]|uniref:Uncharacterized protein n=1 Tax=Tanacetum coccineum TaxID=301880 RepID=A0ABQ5IL46_9ASTR